MTFSNEPITYLTSTTFTRSHDHQWRLFSITSWLTSWRPILSYGCFLKWWYPHFTPQNDHFLIGKPHGCWGNRETHHFRVQPPISDPDLSWCPTWHDSPRIHILDRVDGLGPPEGTSRLEVAYPGDGKVGRPCGTTGMSTRNSGG